MAMIVAVVLLSLLMDLMYDFVVAAVVHDEFARKENLKVIHLLLLSLVKLSFAER